ncbi:unnamed protein product [Clonostachys rhizophaga]|uniref:Uncharacterized protein n=1 Tax=Clonostachys rhizophaga TaxID=160324 RepID=A0A9N9W258_9HYPO|nr:unnamed protein product [Clonostachys rhizophaga]
MSPIERLPTEIVQFIAELCTWDSAPPKYGFPSRIDADRYRCDEAWEPRFRHFYDILNERLYTRNLSRDPNYCSCLRWAVRHNRLETIQRAVTYGADLSSYGLPSDVVYSNTIYGATDYRMKVNGVLIPCTEYQFHSSWGPPLSDAASRGFTEIVAFLLEAGVDVEKETQHRTSFPLERAIQNGHEKVAEMLVSRGAYRSRRDLSALPSAFAKDFKGVVTTLLQRNENDGASFNGKLLYGASSDNLELVTQCLKDSKANVNTQDTMGNTALHLAINSPNRGLEVVKFILQQPGVGTFFGDNEGKAPVHLAALKGRMDIVRLLAEMPDFDVNDRTNMDKTVLHMAAQAASLETFTYFLKHPDFNDPEREDLRKVLEIISRMSDEDLAKDFVDRLVERVALLEPDSSAVVNAIHYGNLSTASKLLSLTSQEYFDSEYVREARRRGRSGPLHHALMLQDPRVTTFVKKLIARGADVQIASRYSSVPWQVMMSEATPIFFAATFARNTDCMKMLFEAGADATSAVQALGTQGSGHRTMSMLSALFSYVWRERWGLVKWPVQYSGLKEPPIAQSMSELEDQILMLLQHGATLNKVGDYSSALSLVCKDALQTSSFSFLRWLTDNSTARNVSVEHVDSLLWKHPLVEDEQEQRKLHDRIGEPEDYHGFIKCLKKLGEIHKILKGFKEKLLREGIQD